MFGLGVVLTFMWKEHLHTMRIIGSVAIGIGVIGDCFQ